MTELIRLNFPILKSTQTWVKEHLEQIPARGWLVVSAGQQTAGMGTQEKTWYSPPGNIYVTLAIKLPSTLSLEKIAYKNQFAQITSLAVAETLEKFGCAPQLRWVNDVLLNGKKIAGVLAEIVMNAKREPCLLIGVGINVNLQSSETGEYTKIITSLRMERNAVFDLQAIFESFLKSFCKNMNDYLTHENTEGLTQKIQAHLIASCGEMITLIVDGEKICGTFLGLDPNGQLKLRIKNRVAIFNHGSMVKEILNSKF